jgi:hypothetical protein
MVGSSYYYNGVSINVPRMEDGKEYKVNAYYLIYDKCQSKWQPASDVLRIKKEAFINATDNLTHIKTHKNQLNINENRISQDSISEKLDSNEIESISFEENYGSIPINQAIESFHRCKKTIEGWVSPKDYFNQLQNDIKNFNPDDFRDFYKNEIYFEIIQVERNTKFLKLKNN